MAITLTSWFSGAPSPLKIISKSTNCFKRMDAGWIFGFRSIARAVALFVFCTLFLAEPYCLAAEPDKGKESKGVGSSIKSIMGDSKGKDDAPLYVKSDALNLDSKGRVFTYSGNVEVVRGEVTITADIVEGHYGEDNQIKTIVARKNVVITSGQTMRATSNRAVYRVGDAKIELTEGPELYRNGNALAADKVTVFIDEDRSEAEGNVRVKVIKQDEESVGR